MAEIEADLLPQYKTVEIQVLGTWPHRGNVELYFKHRYQNFNYRIGSFNTSAKLSGCLKSRSGYKKALSV
ncbi:hypothetical protein IQ274_33375 [Nostoc sp. LEGE 12447]|uniref:hypothetical protein n=1 Tax=Nostoc sp. LEGE 12447 TaxID=1828640 RepID=UPI001A021086|nr:hypothetical protein [Nostoc sp. LEGE 12447]MBE9002942.1 hypothetical protein [Nostoc sp. LEGE 12447]